MAVVRDGHVVWAGAFGTRNDSAQTPVDTATVFEAASLSKPVFAYLVLRLADRGELDLDRPLAEMLEYPRLPPDERARRITARLVLSHGTGLPNWGGERLTLQFEPGTAYGYSGEGFVYLQKAIERATGHSLEALARREVFEPLGMTRSSYAWQERFEGNAASAKDWLWRAAPIDRWVEPNAAYTLLTTAPDYARFVAAVLTGRGLSPATWQAFLTPVRETSPGIAMGLGVRVENGPDGRIFYHSGNNGRRFTCYMTGDVGRGTGLVYFTNASNGTSLVEALAGPVFRGALVAPPRRVRSIRRPSPGGDPLDPAGCGGGGCRCGARAAPARPGRFVGAPVVNDMLALGEFFAGRGLAPLSSRCWSRRLPTLLGSGCRAPVARPGAGGRGSARPGARVVPPGPGARSRSGGDGAAHPLGGATAGGACAAGRGGSAHPRALPGSLRRASRQPAATDASSTRAARIPPRRSPR